MWECLALHVVKRQTAEDSYSLEVRSLFSLARIKVSALFAMSFALVRWRRLVPAEWASDIAILNYPS